MVITVVEGRNRDGSPEQQLCQKLHRVSAPTGRRAIVNMIGLYETVVSCSTIETRVFLCYTREEGKWRGSE